MKKETSQEPVSVAGFGVRGLSWHVWGVSATQRRTAGESHWMPSENMGKQGEEMTICLSVQRVLTLAYDRGDAKVVFGQSGDLACLPSKMKPEAESRNFCGPSYPPEQLGGLCKPWLRDSLSVSGWEKALLT